MNIQPLWSFKKLMISYKQFTVASPSNCETEKLEKLLEFTVQIGSLITFSRRKRRLKNKIEFLSFLL